jgi:uncharacterized HhH-GPD family protein
MRGDLYITGDPDSDELLNTDPLALLIGMLLDQQVPMEWAFGAPPKLKERLGGEIDATHIASMPLEELEVVFKGPPALHRFPGSMAKRTQQVCQHLVEHHDGRAQDLWEGAADAQDLFKRLTALPGYGKEKAKIFMAMLAKRFGIKPAGWEEVAAPFSDDERRSIADVESPETLLEVRAWKKAMKAAGKAKDE